MMNIQLIFEKKKEHYKQELAATIEERERKITELSEANMVMSNNFLGPFFDKTPLSLSVGAV
jgi:hypothetical protein